MGWHLEYIASAIAASCLLSGVHIPEPIAAIVITSDACLGYDMYGTQTPAFFVDITGSFDSGIDCGGRLALGPAPRLSTYARHGGDS